MFSVSPECWQLGLRAGAMILRGLHIGPCSPAQREQIERAASQIRDQFSGPAAIRGLPELVKLYDILRRVGVKPRSHPPSTQRLLEFAWKQATLPAVNNLVDAYNLVSLRTRCSLGAHDLDRLQLPVQLGLFRGDESFRPLGSGASQQVVPGEFGYRDADNRVICRLDSRQADFSKVTVETSNALLIVESTTVHEPQQLERVFAETAETVCAFCGGTAEVIALPYAS